MALQTYVTSSFTGLDLAQPKIENRPRFLTILTFEVIAISKVEIQPDYPGNGLLPVCHETLSC